MDISIRFPATGGILLRSNELFSRPDSAVCRQFIERLFEVEEVRGLDLHTKERTARLSCRQRNGTPRDIVAALVRSLRNGHGNGSSPPDPAPGDRDHPGPQSGNGTDPASPAASGHHALMTGALPLRATLRPDSSGVVRIFRHGTFLSDWEVKHEIPGRMRLKHAALHRKSEICEKIERELMSALGVSNYKTNPLTGTVLVTYDRKKLRRDQVIEILQIALEQSEATGRFDRQDLDFAATTTAVPVAALAQFMAPALLPLSAAMLIYTSVTTFKEAYHVLFREKRLGVDVLDAIVVVACLGTGSIFAGAVLCWCLSFGRMLVKKTQDNSKRMLLNVFGKQPRFVWVYRDGTEVETPLERVAKGDLIVVNTGEAVPVDGTIRTGMAMIDQHALTGESQPIEKVAGDRVFASTVLVAGKIYVEVEKAGSETASAQIATILNETAGYKLSSQHRGEKLADKAVIPTLGLGALGLVTLGPQVATAVLNSDFGTGIRMAAPLGMLSSLALCAQHGILVKDGRALELLYEIDTVLFDKTGTLTREIPEVGEIYTSGGFDPARILTYAAAAEHRMSHPIARAITERFETLGLPLPPTDDSSYKVGFGIAVVVEGRLIRVGSMRFMEMEGIDIPAGIRAALEHAHAQGHSLVMVAVDSQLGGALELRSSRRPEALGIVQGLRQRGVSHVGIISGDQEAPTRMLAESLGMDEYFANVLPADKAQYVESLQRKGRKVCFVGDGINDSIALKKADVSISLRGATSIATDTAQIVFMEESLSRMCDLMDISKGLERNVRRSWQLILLPNALCIVGAFTLGFGIMASVLTNNVAAIAALANGLLPLREVARLEAQKEVEQELRLKLSGTPSPV